MPQRASIVRPNMNCKRHWQGNFWVSSLCRFNRLLLRHERHGKGKGSFAGHRGGFNGVGFLRLNRLGLPPLCHPRPYMPIYGPSGRSTASLEAGE